MSSGVRVTKSKLVSSKGTFPVDNLDLGKDVYTFRWAIWWEPCKTDMALQAIEQEIIASFEGSTDYRHIYIPDTRDNIGYISRIDFSTDRVGRGEVQISCYGLFGSSATNLENALRPRLNEFLQGAHREYSEEGFNKVKNT